MPWLEYKTPYNSILKDIKKRGIKVFHRKLKDDTIGGLFDPDKIIITISKDMQYTKEGCFLLLHEFSHYNQYREGMFKDFFDPYIKYNRSHLPMIIEAELDACKRAHKLLKMWGIDYLPRELTPNGEKEATKFWKKFYIKD